MAIIMPINSSMMKHVLPVLLLAFFGTSISFSQSLKWGTNYPVFERPAVPCLPSDERSLLLEEIAENRRQLVERGILPARAGGGSVTFGHPLEVAPSSDWVSGWGVSFFPDNDPSSGLEDYLCLERTYDGHQGTDYSLFPFGFHQIENELLHVVAAAPGTIIFKHDGEFDEQCEWLNGVTWNAVFVEHEDGSTALYGHLKNGSVTSLNVGESVALGDYLGVPASSGYSSGPHLHFEVLDSNGNWFEPHVGNCSSASSSAWTDQLPYWDKRINAITIHDSVPSFGCPSSEESTRFEYDFTPGDSVYGYIFVVSIQQGDSFYTSVKRPDGSIFTDYLTVSPGDFPGMPLVASIELPDTAMVGAWSIETQFQGSDTLSAEFYVHSTSTVEDHETDILDLYPNPVNDNLFINIPETVLPNEKYGIRVFSSDGKLVHDEQTSDFSKNRFVLTTRDFKPGMYQIQLSSADAVWSGSFVKAD